MLFVTTSSQGTRKGQIVKKTCFKKKNRSHMKIIFTKIGFTVILSADSFCGKRIYNSIYFKPVRQNKVEGIISMCNRNRPQGIDNIPVRLIRLANAISTSYSTRMVNNFITIGQYPDALKIARVTPIYRKRSQTKLSNYRPISRLLK